EEGHAGFAGRGAREQGLAGAGRPGEQDAPRRPTAELAELSRVSEKLDGLRERPLGFFHASDVLEGDLRATTRRKVRDVRGALPPPRRVADADHAEDDNGGQKRRDEPARILRAGGEPNLDALFGEQRGKRRLRLTCRNDG